MCLKIVMKKALNKNYFINFKVFLMYFSMYFLFFIQTDVNLVNAAIRFYPIISSPKHECFEETDQNLDTCYNKVWVLYKEKKLKDSIKESTSKDLHGCFQFCLETPKCIAISRDSTKPTHCWLFSENLGKEKRYRDVTAYLLKCCELKRKRLDLVDQDYPIVLNDDALIKNTVDTNPVTCQHLVWRQDERSTFDESLLYKHFWAKDTVLCMNECLKEKDKCTGFRVDFKECATCSLYRGSKKPNYIKIIEKTAYFLTCARLNSTALLNKKGASMAMVYNPHRICKTVSTSNVKSCPNKIWHVEEGLRLIDTRDYTQGGLYWLSECLEWCDNHENCLALSVDRLGMRCYLFWGNEYKKQIREFLWVTYTLKCCDEFKNENFYERNWLNRVSDSLEFATYPVISNLNEDCLPQVNREIQTCPNKAWLVVDNLRMKNNSNTDESNDYFCFSDCLENANCSKFSMEMSKKSRCWLQSENNENEIANGYRTFYSTCCILKEKIIESKKSHILNSNFPIVFEQEKMCQSKNRYTIVCNYPTWHMQENVALSSSSSLLRTFNITNTIDCLNACALEYKCKAISVVNLSPFFSVCQLFAAAGTKSGGKQRTIVYEKFCCKLSTAADWQSNHQVLHSRPERICKSLDKSLDNCATKVWMMQDGVRLKGHHKAIDLVSVQSCLQQCLSTQSCSAVSIDFNKYRCLLFGGTGFTDYGNQLLWTTFHLKCCEDVGNPKLG